MCEKLYLSRDSNLWPPYPRRRMTIRPNHQTTETTVDQFEIYRSPFLSCLQHLWERGYSRVDLNRSEVPTKCFPVMKCTKWTICSTWYVRLWTRDMIYHMICAHGGAGRVIDASHNWHLKRTQNTADPVTDWMADHLTFHLRHDGNW